MTNQTPSASGPKSPRRELLEEAADLIDGDRNISYGSPTQNFENIADLWTTRFSHMLKDGESFTAADVADAMILLKVARNIASQKRDNWADIAGYAGCGYESTLPPVAEPTKFARGGIVSGGEATYITVNTSPGLDDVATSTAHRIKREVDRAASDRVKRRR